ncbi:hypothetical protein MMC07_001421 [Pseudocyphellaria aurata]|nr:hypothetical protein [Pseudocyphellaria aurata]
MKVILSGPTGFIGREVLEQCLQNSAITFIVALSRREIPVNSPKLRVIIIKDFLSYPDSILHDTKDVGACIWSLGRAQMPDNDTARKISIEYTLAAAKAFTPASSTEKKFRFVYLSGAASERDQTKPLWFMQEYRRIRGQVENELIAYAQKHQDTFETCIMRPSFVLAKKTNLKELIKSLVPSVRVDVLAAAMIDVALNGIQHQIVENTNISTEISRRTNTGA